MRYCQKCGFQNPDDARWCGNCDESLPLAGRFDPNGYGKYIMQKYKRKSGLFRNAGPKLRTLAWICFVLVLAGGLVGGIALIVNGAESYYGGGTLIAIGIVTLIATPFIAWLGAIVTYAFGELCDNVNQIRIAFTTKE